MQSKRAEYTVLLRCLWSFAHVVHRDQMNRARNIDHAARTCQRFSLFYSQNNKIVWLSNMAEHFWRNSRGAQRFVGFYYLSVRFRCWLAERQTPITWRAGWKYCILLPYAEKQPTRDNLNRHSVYSNIIGGVFDKSTSVSLYESIRLCCQEFSSSFFNDDDDDDVSLQWKKLKKVH